MGRTPLFYAAQLKRDDLIYFIKVAQIVFEAALRNTKRSELITGLHPNLEKVSLRSSVPAFPFTDNENNPTSYLQLGDIDFRNLYMDVLNEIDRRLSGTNMSSQAGVVPRDGSQKLALLEPTDFMGLAQTVFEEQTQRENAVIYVARFKPSSDSKLDFFPLLFVFLG